MTEKHFIEVEDSEDVAAVHHKADSDKWIFFCHGFGSDKEGSYEKRCERSVEEGYNAVRFDFRGNGESDGAFIEQTLDSKIKDLRTVIEYFDPDNYILFGMSFGGKAVFHYAIQDEDVKAIIAKSPVTYNQIMEKFRFVVEEKGEYTYFEDKTIDHRFVESLEENPFEEVTENLEIPVAFFHGRSDTTVHPKFTWKAAKELNKDTIVEMFESEKHQMTDSANERILDSMFDWLDT